MGERRERLERLLEAVRDVVAEDLRLGLERDQVQPDTSLFGTGLGLDSVDAVDLAMGIETRTGIKLPDTWEGRAAMRSVNHLIGFVERQGGDVLPEDVQRAAREAAGQGMTDQMRDFAARARGEEP